MYGAVSVQFRATARLKFDSRVKFNVNAANSVGKYVVSYDL